MRLFDLIMFILAAVFFLIAAVAASNSSTSNGHVIHGRATMFVALGLLAWVLVPLVATARALN